MRRPNTYLVVALLTGLGLVAGCGATGDDSTEGAASDMEAAAPAEGGAAADAGAGSGDLGAQAAPDADPARIIYTADVRVRVDDPAEAARRAVELVEAAGGSLASQAEVDGEDQVTVSVRVPVAGFRSALDAVAELGTVLDRHVDAQDVTDQVVDLEGRLENARASADRLRELYGTAADVEQIVAIEQALTEREAEVESLAGQLQQLEDQADRSTITVTFVDEGEVVEDDDDANAFVRGLRGGRDVVVGGATVVAAVAGFLVPFSPVLLIGGVAAIVTTRRTRRRAARAAAPTTGPPADTPPEDDPPRDDPPPDTSPPR